MIQVSLLKDTVKYSIIKNKVLLDVPFSFYESAQLLRVPSLIFNIWKV
jgi:hypothetical protein